MWLKLSLRTRINALIALMLALGLVINVARLVVAAGPRVQAEDQSVIRLAREFIQAIVGGLNEATDGSARLDQMVQDLNRLRHISIVRQGDVAEASSKTSHVDDGARSPPAWFVAWVHPQTISVTVPVVIGDKRQSLLITSHPDDEMAEIWDGIVTQLVIGSLVAIVLFFVTSMALGRALRPLQALSDAMMAIEAGRYDTRVSPGGAPELAAICMRLNHLAATLGQALESRRQLAERAVSLQDMERKDIARELHDEFGPHLFALRAHASALMRLSETRGSGIDALQNHSATILAQTDALQQFNRRILEKLRPVGLAELGLHEALNVLLRQWRETHADIAIDARISIAPNGRSEAADLTIYRLVQEALTNAFRHGRATSVGIDIADAAAGRNEGGRVLLRVQDNGRGLEPDHKPGLGLTGMHERVWALGGTLAIASLEEGVRVEAIVPNDLRH